MEWLFFPFIAANFLKKCLCRKIQFMNNPIKTSTLRFVTTKPLQLVLAYLVCQITMQFKINDIYSIALFYQSLLTSLLMDCFVVQRYID